MALHISPELSKPDIFDFSVHKREYTIVVKYYPPGLERMLRAAILIDYARAYNFTTADRTKLYREIAAKKKPFLDTLTEVFVMEDLVAAWYAHFAPDKEVDIDAILEKYIYCEDRMFNIMYRKYVDPLHKNTPLWFHDENCDAR